MAGRPPIRWNTLPLLLLLSASNRAAALSCCKMPDIWCSCVCMSPTSSPVIHGVHANRASILQDSNTQLRSTQTQSSRKASTRLHHAQELLRTVAPDYHQHTCKCNWRRRLVWTGKLLSWLLIVQFRLPVIECKHSIAGRLPARKPVEDAAGALIRARCLANDDPLRNRRIGQRARQQLELGGSWSQPRQPLPRWL